MNRSKRRVRLAVGTLVLAALAVSESAACPLGREVDLEQPVLPWQRPASLVVARVATLATVTLITAVGDGTAVVKTLARVELRCGSGRGDATVQIRRGQAAVTTTGFDPIVAACVRGAFEDARFTRVASGTIARVRVAF